MSFPDTNFLGIPKGWENLGKQSKITKVVNGENITTYDVHLLCNNRLNIGSEDGKLFQFCKRCKIKITN